MSQNQSRGDRSDSTQYKKTGRSFSSNQQGNFGGGASAKGGGGASALANPNNRSFKKYNNNAQGGQFRPKSPNLSSDSGNSSAAHAVQNGPHHHQQQPTHRVSDAPVTSTPSDVKLTNAPTQKINAAVTRATSTNVSSVAPPPNISELRAPTTPAKGGPAKSFPLQFGSISPGFVNGMQIPPRTSSAPPNLDEQKKAQVCGSLLSGCLPGTGKLLSGVRWNIVEGLRGIIIYDGKEIIVSSNGGMKEGKAALLSIKARHESLKAVPAMPIPSIPKQQSRKKETGISDQPNACEAQPVSKSKRDTQVSAAPPVTQTQKPAVHPIPNMPMQRPFHQPQVPVPFGGPNPHIPSQAMSGTSLPMPMQMHLPMGNPPMFVSGLQPHHIQSQGIIHQGQNLNFSSQMGHQLPPQLGNMGMNMASQFPQQQAGKYSGARKAVKITHPETHEELRLDGSPAPRSHPNVPPQSQPIPSFPPNHPMNFYPNPYNASSLFYHAAPPTSQPPRLYNQVTVKPPVEKEPLAAANSLPAGKTESSKPSRLHGEDLVRPQKEIESSSLPDSIKDKHKKPGTKDQQAQVCRQSTLLSNLPSPLPEAESVEAKSNSSSTDFVPETGKESLSTTAAASSDVSNSTIEGAAGGKRSDTSKSLDMKGVKSGLSKPEPVEIKEQKEAISSESSKPDKHSLEISLNSMSLQSPEITAKTEESSDQETVSVKYTEQKQEESPGRRSNDVKIADNLAVSTHTEVGEGTDRSVLANGLYRHDGEISTSGELSMPDSVGTSDGEISTSGTSLSLPDSIGTSETSLANSSVVDQKPTPLLIPSPSEGALGPENAGFDNNSGGLVSRSPSSVKDKVLSDATAAKSSVPRGKMKKKDLYKKAEAAGTSSDLYNAYKGPEEKKETIISPEGTEDTCMQASADLSQENAVSSPKPAQSKMEPDDWEDAAEISTPDLETSKDETNDGDGNGLMTKRYSRDFLLKFMYQCTDLPKAFKTSDLPDVLVSSVNVSRESYPSPGRNIDRPGSGSRPDRRGSGLGDDDKWSKMPGPLMSGRGDMWAEVGYAGNVVGFRPVQGVDYGVLRNPRAQTPVQHAGGILSGPMQSHGPQGGVQRNNSDSDRWQRGTSFQKGLMPYPQAPLMHKAEKKYEVGKVTDEEQAKQRQLKGILNKLTPQNFEKLFQQVKEVNIDNVTTLTGVISQIFDKALMEPTFCEMYANFCSHLAAALPDLSVEKEKVTFKRLLLNKCQEEFERGEREEEEANKAEEEGEAKQTAEEREEKRIRVRRRMLGNIRLIGELYKKKMLTERIMHECIHKLLGQHENPDEENIEALCKLMSTIGEMIDHHKAKGHMDSYFVNMSQLSNNMKLSSRVRFMLKDVIDLRKNKWQQRRKVEGPKKIEDVHRDAAQERLAQSSRLSRGASMGSSVRRGPPMDFTQRAPTSMLSSPSAQIGGFRSVAPQMRGYGSQDARIEERHSFENRPVPLPQRPVGDDSITLGPQGGLVRGMAFREQPSLPSLNGFSSMPERMAYGQREDLIPRHPSDRFDPPSNYGQSHPQERSVAYGNREVRNADRRFDRSVPTSPPARGGPPTSMPSENLWTEERLRDKSLAAIKEFYSARDENEVALCIKDLNTPSFYPSMISVWITDSFERKGVERDLLTKLLINLSKPRDGLISEDQLVKGFESVLAILEDAVNDAPKAAEFLGCIFARIILENVVSLSEIGRLIYEGGEEKGRLVEMGLAAEVLGTILDIIKSEKGDSVLTEIRSSSNPRLENFRPPGSNKSLRIDKFI
ncbi:hypothetical protein BUALT_Bualt19G0025800 [Buddleja alternifolia]|uniref:Eukaryotic translation initiation factor 4G n=1 Tax=Buddleja alternifolia TaxID=168488 RepID=A0AAV6W4K9_9LAMI|nr:hypothetical protein BUALT_Bualt19G0025800 [Buddleja alternifolia]